MPSNKFSDSKRHLVQIVDPGQHLLPSSPPPLVQTAIVPFTAYTNNNINSINNINTSSSLSTLRPLSSIATQLPRERMSDDESSSNNDMNDDDNNDSSKDINNVDMEMDSEPVMLNSSYSTQRMSSL